MAESNVTKSIKEITAQNVKNITTSVNAVRDTLMMLEIEDEFAFQLVDEINKLASELRIYLENKHQLPHWYDTWGQPRFWKHPDEVQ